MSEDKLRASAGKGRKAEGLLKDELLTEAFDALERTYTDAWKQTTEPEHSARERYWLATNILIDVRNHLRKVAVNGRLAQKELDNLGKLNRLR